MILYLILPAVPNQLELAPTYVLCKLFSLGDFDIDPFQALYKWAPCLWDIYRS